MSGDADKFAELYRFLEVEFPGRAFNSASPNWRLEEDLGIYGDEAVDFLLRFSERFNVDISGFDLSTHFGKEDSLGYYMRKLLNWPRTLKPSPSIEDLKSAMETGRL